MFQFGDMLSLIGVGILVTFGVAQSPTLPGDF